MFNENKSIVGLYYLLRDVWGAVSDPWDGDKVDYTDRRHRRGCKCTPLRTGTDPSRSKGTIRNWKERLGHFPDLHLDLLHERMTWLVLQLLLQVPLQHFHHDLLSPLNLKHKLMGIIRMHFLTKQVYDIPWQLSVAPIGGKSVSSVRDTGRLQDGTNSGALIQSERIGGLGFTGTVVLHSLSCRYL